MPTIFSHPAVALGLAPWFRRVPKSLVAIAAVCSAVPDADVAAFGFGIPYEHPFGHRGFTHSLVFAALFAAFVTFSYLRLARSELPFRVAFPFVFLVIASHGVLDAMTTGGRGVGFLIPFSNRRFFFPFRPIRVSPIGAQDFLERAGPVLRSEILWVWIPFIGLAIVGALVARGVSREKSQQS
jgi:inner membrane protein